MLDRATFAHMEAGMALATDRQLSFLNGTESNKTGFSDDANQKSIVAAQAEIVVDVLDNLFKDGDGQLFALKLSTPITTPE